MKFRCSLVFSSIAALLYGATAAAQTAPTDSENPAQETIVVLGNKHNNTSAPAGKSEFLDFSEFSPQVSNISELVADTPGAELSGQGGLFQVYALRGMSRWRVLTQIAGVPIHTERRAGTAASFISPWLLGQVEVIKGPVSTLYGSGGMAGLTQLQPRHFEGTAIQTAISSDGKSRNKNIGWGNDDYSVAFSHQKENNTQTASGQAINNHFEQNSGSFLGNWALTGDIQSQLMVIASRGKDIGKANNEDFENEKYINYPEENHLLAQYALVSDDDWQARFGFHKQDLLTETTRFGKRINTVDTQATDYSLSFSKTWRQKQFSGQWGVEQEYRDNITATEREVSLTSDNIVNSEFLSASQYNAALFGNINYQWNDWGFAIGARANYIKQSSGFDLPEHQDRSDTANTYFASAAYQLNKQWRVTSSFSTGFRFPTVTERFYNGTTARGNTYGDPTLEAETARNFELGLAYSHSNIGFEINGFSNHVDNYIERVDVDEDTRTYRNLNEGKIRGIEFGFNHRLNDDFSYQLSGHHLKGEDEQGNPIADISPNKLQLSLNYHYNAFTGKLKVKHRFDHDDIASGEQSLDSVNVVSANLSYQINPSWQVSLWADNLLDKEYVLTSDKKSAFAQQRQVGLTLSWNMD